MNLCGSFDQAEDVCVGQDVCDNTLEREVISHEIKQIRQCGFNSSGAKRILNIVLAMSALGQSFGAADTCSALESPACMSREPWKRRFRLELDQHFCFGAVHDEPALLSLCLGMEERNFSLMNRREIELENSYSSYSEPDNEPISAMDLPEDQVPPLLLSGVQKL